jgi:DNA-binding transcriptional LysR family regulator
MTVAASELHVTHGAVSRQVRALEALLGVRLVVGPRHQLHLTEAGARLAHATSSAFELIATALPGAGEESQIVLSCLGTLAMKWLIPRLPDFLGRHPGLRVRIVESHAPVDFSEGGLHAAIRVITGRAPQDVRSASFMDHFHGPVLSPIAWANCDGDLERLLMLPRLHSETFRPAWEMWAQRASVPLPTAVEDREFEHNSYMLEAAAAGLGVAVAPWAFAAADIERGRLIAPFGFERVDAQFALLRPRHAANAGVDALSDWLMEQGRASPDPPVASLLAAASA